MQTPITEIPEIMLMALCDFFEKRYRLAMKNGKFNLKFRSNKNLRHKLFFQKSINLFKIV